MRGDQEQLFVVVVVVVVGGAVLSDRSCYYIGRISTCRNTDVSYIYHFLRSPKRKASFFFLLEF